MVSRTSGLLRNRCASRVLAITRLEALLRIPERAKMTELESVRGRQGEVVTMVWRVDAIQETGELVHVGLLRTIDRPSREAKPMGHHTKRPL